MEQAIMAGLFAIAAAVAAGLAAVGAGVGDGLVGAKVLEGMTRQPEMRGKLMSTMFIMVGLIEALPIIAIVIAIYFGFVK